MLTRRRLLQLSAAGAAATSLRCGGDGGDDDDLPGGAYELGAATFEVRDDRAVLWGYAKTPTDAVFELIGGGAERALPVELAAAAGGTGAVIADGLMPGTSYRYTLRTAAGDHTPEHQFTTAPAPETFAPLRFLVSGDLDEDPQFDSPILDTMGASDAAFYVSLGDWPYAGSRMTLDEYRYAHWQHRQRPHLQRFVHRFPLYGIYDDHELRNNWDAMFRDAEAERIAAGLQAWDEWWPLHPTSPHRRYRNWRWGSGVEIWMLDVRLYRSANADPDGPQKTMLGAEQKQWLKDTLAASTATFKLLMNPVPLDLGKGSDHWNAFATERAELIDFIVGSDIGGVVVFTADMHWFAAHHHAHGIKEYQVGSLARGIPEPPNEHPLRVGSAFVFNYGEVTVGGDALEFVARDADGAELYRETVAAGRGALAITSQTPGRAFTVAGAHTFVGTTPASFPYAVPGTYQLRFDGTDELYVGELAAGDTLTLSDAPA